jgi:hypothetical protein
MASLSPPGNFILCSEWACGCPYCDVNPRTDSPIQKRTDVAFSPDFKMEVRWLANRNRIPSCTSERDGIAFLDLSPSVLPGMDSRKAQMVIKSVERASLELEFKRQYVTVAMHHAGVDNIAICDSKCWRTGFGVQVPSCIISCASTADTRTHSSAERVFQMRKMGITGAV